MASLRGCLPHDHLHCSFTPSKCKVASERIREADESQTALSIRLAAFEASEDREVTAETAARDRIEELSEQLEVVTSHIHVIIRLTWLYHNQ